MSHIDSHCHLDAPEFDVDRPEVAQRAIAAGVETLILPGVRIEDAEGPLLELPGMQVLKAVGLHPFFDHPPDALMRLERVLRRGGVVALGEIGLDRRHPTEPHLLEAQLELGIDFDLPLILHVVHAHEPVLELLQERPQLRGVVHAFAGSWELAQRYLSLGFKLGFGGLVTRLDARKLHKTVANCPADGFVLETDSPDLPVFAKLGQRNEPSELVAVADAVSKLRDCSREEVLTCSDGTAQALFRLPSK